MATAVIICNDNIVTLYHFAKKMVEDYDTDMMMFMVVVMIMKITMMSVIK